MTNTKTYRALALFCLSIALVVGVTAGAGAFMRGDGSMATGESIRGERFEYATTGVYKWNPERVVAEGVGWDWVTLFLAVPALLAALPGVARGSLRARLFAAGVLGYFVYQYLMYAVFWAFGPLFPLFVVVYPAAFAGIVWIVSTVDVRSLPQRFTEKFPRRGVAVFSIVMGLMLVAMWTARIVAAMKGDWDGAGLLGMPTLSVQALDLGIVVPLALATGLLALRRAPWGYLLASVFMIKGVSMSAAICAMLISAWMVEGTLDAGFFAVFGTATLAAAWLAALVYGSVREVDPSAAVPVSAAA